ncbi:uncharacterized protein LOC113053478, partial [Xyrichtys novacula]
KMLLTSGPVTNSTSTGTNRSVLLPSVPHRPATHSRVWRKNKTCKHYTRDVVCLPFSSSSSVSSSTLRIPRGDSRAKLAQDGLIGKISFTSDWSEAQLRDEITAIFRRTFALPIGQPLPFEYLSTVKGCKKLMKPNVSSNFLWGGKEVGSITSTSCLYILALMHKPIQEPEELSEDDFESPVCLRRRVHTMESDMDKDELHQETEDVRQGSVNNRLRENPLHQILPSLSAFPHAVGGTVPSPLMEGEAGHLETESSTLDGDNEREAEEPRQLFPYNVAEFIPFYLEEEEALEEAIQRSLIEDSAGPSTVHTLRSSEKLSKEEIAGLLRAHSEKVITSGTRKIFISRANVWTTTLRQFKRPRFAESCDMLYVTFASDEHGCEEDAADLGGPRREFFRLLVKAIFQDSGAFEGTPNGYTPRLNILHLQNGLYRTIGRMISTIIVQGGEPPAFLAPHVVDYILYGDILQLHLTPADIGDPELRENLKKVQHATTPDELEEAVSCCDSWRFQVEGLPHIVTMDNRDIFVKNAALYHGVLQRQSSLDQLLDGLSYYGVLSLLRENPGVRVLLDMPEQDSDLAADLVAALLKPSYSVLGSNRRAKEELIVVKFRDFLQCVEDQVAPRPHSAAGVEEGRRRARVGKERQR